MVTNSGRCRHNLTMRRAVLAAVALIAASIQAQQSANGFDSDPRLKTPISMRLKIVSLADFASNLQKLTKVKFSVSTNIEDRKITTIFHDRPILEVMNALQDAMFMEWKRDGDGYRLALSPAVSREEQQITAAEDQAVRDGMLKGLQGIAQNFGLAQKEIDARERALDGQIAELHQDPSPDAQLHIAALQDEKYSLYSPSGPAICRAYSNDFPGAIDSLLTGATLSASTRSEDTVPKLPIGYIDHLASVVPNAFSCVVMMRFDPIRGSIDGRASVSNSANGSVTTTEGFTYTPLLHNPLDPKASKLLARLDSWEKQTDADVLDRAVSREGRTEDKPGYVPFQDPGYTLAEHLEYIADHSDIPVVADAFRTYCSGPQFRGDATVRTYVEGLKVSKYFSNGILPPPVPYFASKNGWLMARHRTYWRRLLQEIPESLLLPLETAARRKDFPSLDDYCRLLGSLSFDQFNSLKYNTYDHAFRFNEEPFNLSLGSLVFWTSLSSDQAAAAAAGQLKLTELSNSQAKLAVDLWAEKMWMGHLTPDVWASFLSPKGFAGMHPILKFYYNEFRPNGTDQEKEFLKSMGQSKPYQSVGFAYYMGANIQIHDGYLIPTTHE